MADGRIALCLSGGGLRATLFHLGVVRALRRSEFEGESALRRVTEIYSVSGGSILAAHLLLRWDDYIADDKAFAKAEAEILAFARRNVRDRVLRRSALSFLPLRLWNLMSSRYVSGRTQWLMGEYQALLGSTTLSGCIGEPGTKPKLHILTTNFMTGELCSFSGDRFEVERSDRMLPLLETPCGHLTLTRAVAASSAFPPMFPPMRIDDQLLSRPRDEAFLQPLLLSDGGVFDNLGIEKFWRNKERNKNAPRTLIISNAGSPFRSEAAKTYAGTVSRNVRASDILMRRVGVHSEREIAKATDTDDIVVRLTDGVEHSTLDDTVQQPLRLVRTDLDRFSPELSQLIVEHGKEAARQQFTRRGWPWIGSDSTWPNTPADRTRQQRIALKAAGRSFWMLPFDVRDWVPLLLLWAIAAAVGWQGYSLWSVYDNAKQAQALAREKEREQLESYETQLAAATDALRRNDLPALNQVLLGAIDQTQAEQEQIERELTPAPVPPPAPATVDLPPQQVPYRQPVYIQFAGRMTRQQIVALNEALRANGWNVQGPSGERIAAASRLNEVRYSGDNREAAERLASAITTAGITSRTVTAQPNSVVGTQNLEVWISN